MALLNKVKAQFAAKSTATATIPPPDSSNPHVKVATAASPTPSSPDASTHQHPRNASTPFSSSAPGILQNPTPAPISPPAQAALEDTLIPPVKPSSGPSTNSQSAQSDVSLQSRSLSGTSIQQVPQGEATAHTRREAPCTSLKFAPLPIPQMDDEDENRRKSGHSASSNADHAKPLDVTTSPEHAQLNVDKPDTSVSPHSKQGSASPRFEGDHHEHGGDTEEIWCDDAAIEANASGDDGISTTTNKKSFRCIASRSRSPNGSTSGSMSYSRSASFGAILRPLSPAALITSDQLNTSALDDKDDDDSDHENQDASSIRHEAVEVDEEETQPAANGVDQDDEEQEEEAEKHEAALARSRSMSRAAGVEKVHKHYRPESVTLL